MILLISTHHSAPDGEAVCRWHGSADGETQAAAAINVALARIARDGGSGAVATVMDDATGRVVARVRPRRVG